MNGFHLNGMFTILSVEDEWIASYLVREFKLGRTILVHALYAVPGIELNWVHLQAALLDLVGAVV